MNRHAVARDSFFWRAERPRERYVGWSDCRCLLNDAEEPVVGKDDAFPADHAGVRKSGDPQEGWRGGGNPRVRERQARMPAQLGD